MPPRHLRIGTRGSQMAQRQTALVRDRLVAAHPQLAARRAVEIVTIRTAGDRVQDRLLGEIGGKGLFVKEIEDALIAGHIDLAVPLEPTSPPFESTKGINASEGCAFSALGQSRNSASARHCLKNRR